MDYLALQFADISASGATSTENFSVSMNYPKLELTDMSRTLESLVSQAQFISCLFLVMPLLSRAFIQEACFTYKTWTLNSCIPVNVITLV